MMARFHSILKVNTTLKPFNQARIFLIVLVWYVDNVQKYVGPNHYLGTIPAIPEEAEKNMENPIISRTSNFLNQNRVDNDCNHCAFHLSC
jgi:hypothetical protein